MAEPLCIEHAFGHAVPEAVKVLTEPFEISRSAECAGHAPSIMQFHHGNNRQQRLKLDREPGSHYVARRPFPLVFLRFRESP